MRHFAKNQLAAREGLSFAACPFEDLQAAEKIRAWGVSNFKVSDMEKLFRIPKGDRCATNQVPYSPWCERHGMPVMAYSALGGPGANLLRDRKLASIGASHGCSAAAVALAWTIRGGNVFAIPESGSVTHVKENAEAFSLTLTRRRFKHSMQRIRRPGFCLDCCICCDNSGASRQATQDLKQHLHGNGFTRFGRKLIQVYDPSSPFPASKKPSSTIPNRRLRRSVRP